MKSPRAFVRQTMAATFKPECNYPDDWANCLAQFGEAQAFGLQNRAASQTPLS